MLTIIFLNAIVNNRPLHEFPIVTRKQTEIPTVLQLLITVKRHTENREDVLSHSALVHVLVVSAKTFFS